MTLLLALGLTLLVAWACGLVMALGLASMAAVADDEIPHPEVRVP